MHKLLREDIQLRARTDIVKSEEFSKRLKKVMESYRRSQIDNAKSLDLLLHEYYKDGEFTEEVIREKEDSYGMDIERFTSQEDYTRELHEIIKDLINMARDMVRADQAGAEIGLSKEELSFYNALTFTEGIEDFYEDDVLIKMAKELTRQLKENESIDWQYKQSGRARMRSIVRRLLTKYNYPPEDRKEALQIVLKQCEHWSETRM